MNAKTDRPGKQRAFAMLSIKALVDDGDAWTIRGVATTPTTDRMGDKVNPLGARFKLPMPLLLFHDSAMPVGQVVSAKASKAGITFEATLPKVREPGVVQDRVNEAVHSVQYKLIQATSIGFSPNYEKMEPIDTGWIFNDWEWLELSLVPIPANPEAVITGNKSFDQQLRAASGIAQGSRAPAVAGTRGHPANVNPRPKGNAMKTLSQLRAEREEKVARLNELKTAWDSRESTEDEDQEADALSAEVIKLDGDIRRARIDMFNADTAQQVGEARSTGAGSAARGREARNSPVGKAQADEKFKGQFFTQKCIAAAVARLHGTTAGQIAEHRWGRTNPQLVAVIKANEVAGGGSLSGDWGAELVQADTRYTGDFIEFLYGLTVYDKLPLREVPANVVIKGQDGTGIGYWVGQGKAIPVSKEDFSSVTLSPLKVAALSVVTNELLRDSTPAAEALIRDSLGQASAKRIDQTFISAAAAVANVSPAGILNGLSAIPSTGEDSTALRQDILALYAPFIAALNSSDLAFVTTPSVAKAIGLMISTLGVPLYPGLGTKGGNLLGDTVYTGDNVPARNLVLLKPSDIYKIGDLGVQVSVSQEATIEQSSAPIGNTLTPAAMTQAYTSMFQEESTAFKIVRPINFALRRASVAFISDAAYGLATT